MPFKASLTFILALQIKFLSNNFHLKCLSEMFMFISVLNLTFLPSIFYQISFYLKASDFKFLSSIFKFLVTLSFHVPNLSYCLNFVTFDILNLSPFNLKPFESQTCKLNIKFKVTSQN